jgi:hypothetical protein
MRPCSNSVIARSIKSATSEPYSRTVRSSTGDAKKDAGN